MIFPNICSTEGPISWTSLTDSESRLRRFIEAITSFLCSCSWKRIWYVGRIQTTKIMHDLRIRWEVSVNLLAEQMVGRHWWKTKFLVQSRVPEPEASPKDGTFHTQCNPSMRCRFNKTTELLSGKSIVFDFECNKKDNANKQLSHKRIEKPYISELFLCLPHQFWSTLAFPQFSFVKWFRAGR